MVDFISLNNKKIIEFDGYYWHYVREPRVENNLREKERDNLIINAGYDILHINELDYKKDEDETIKKCMEFLNE
jgi:very-short-patch-repair endonuclease